MRGLLLAACLLLPGRLAAWDELPTMVLLAVPAEDFSQWRSLAGVLGSYSELKLTLALTPGMLTAQVRDILALPLRTGRLELAMRIPGDPILSLVSGEPDSEGPHDVLARLEKALQGQEAPDDLGPEEAEPAEPPLRDLSIAAVPAAPLAAARTESSQPNSGRRGMKAAITSV